MVEKIDRILDITKSVGVPIAGVLAIIYGVFSFSNQISDFKYLNELRYTELSNQNKSSYNDLSNKLDGIKAEIRDNNLKFETELKNIKEYIAARFETEAIRRETVWLKFKTLNPELNIKLPEIK